MYRIKMFNKLSRKLTENEARVLFESMVRTWGTDNIKLVYLGKWEKTR